MCWLAEVGVDYMHSHGQSQEWRMLAQCLCPGVFGGRREPVPKVLHVRVHAGYGAEPDLPGGDARGETEVFAACHG